MRNLKMLPYIRTNLVFKQINYFFLVAFWGVLFIATTKALAYNRASYRCDTIINTDSLSSILQQRLNNYFKNYKLSCYSTLAMGLDYVSIDRGVNNIRVFPKEGFCSQVFSQKIVEDVYKDVASLIPSQLSTYKVEIFCHGVELSRLVPNLCSSKIDSSRLWEKRRYEGNEWVLNLSRPFKISKGLQNVHMTVWPSHGRYYDYSKNNWTWQRPNIFCSTEDLFSRSIVIPFLVPMLENAGAIVYVPTERDMNSIEIIVDNDSDDIKQGGQYKEVSGSKGFDSCNMVGFKQKYEFYIPGMNPHKDGSARMVSTTADSTDISYCQWIPNIPENGEYALYATYPTHKLSVPDAVYTVKHGEIITKIRVNQKMGGNTWVYLGTFYFTKGNNNSVTLSNYSKYYGVVTADAIKIGGGMGNMMRNGQCSGLPRFLEGALYNAQWAGMPFTVYNTKDGRNDYADDINVRSNSLNYLAGGSIYVPDSIGLHVPMELSLAVHSDAGFFKNNSIFGTLAISTRCGDNGSDKFVSGVNRLASSDFASIVQTEVCRDLSRQLGLKWNQRELYNRNYSETRKPEVPSMILETLSHQNFRDMVYGHDPNFKFLLSRAVYKAIVRFVSFQHQRNYIIQPLPIKCFSAIAHNNEALLSWQPQLDSLESTALPTSYIVYISKNGEDFDNGHIISGDMTSIRVPIEKDVIYRFKITACNAGGESFPSEILSVLSSSKEEYKILVVNGFTRLSSPEVISTNDNLGFDIETDIGVPYIKTTEYSGEQIDFKRSKIGVVAPGGLGYSGMELNGRVIAGNSFDYPYIHAKSIQDKRHHYSISSASKEAFENNNVNMYEYQLVDILFGLQRDNGISSICTYKTFTPAMRKNISAYLDKGGNIFVSGSYISRDMKKTEEKTFTSHDLCYSSDSCISTPPLFVLGEKNFSIFSEWNQKFYASKTVEVLKCNSMSEPFVKLQTGECVATVASNVIAFGFPFECIQGDELRSFVMKQVLRKLLLK